MSTQSCRGPAPGFQQRPDHTIVIEPTAHTVRVRSGDLVIAESDGALTLHEGNYPAVHYIPTADVRDGLLVDSDTSTYCPFKGRARYWHLALPDGRRIEDAAWGYPEPYDEMIELRDRLSFYSTKVEIAAD